MKKIISKGKTIIRSLAVHIFLLCLVMLLIQSVLLIHFINTKDSEESAVKVDQYMKTYSETLCRDMDKIFEEINRDSKIILGNELVQNAIKRRYETDFNPIQEVEDNEIIQYIIFSFTALRDGMQMILADRDGEIFLKASGYYNENVNNIFDNAYLSDQRETLDAGAYVVVPAYNSNFYDYGDESVYMLVRSLKDINNGKIIAYMVTLFPAKNINLLLNESAKGIENVEIHILDHSRKIVASTAQNMIGVVLDQSASDSFKEISCDSSSTEWQILLRMPVEYLNKNFVSTWTDVFPLILIMLLVCGLIWCLFIYVDIVIPMKKINSAMKMVELGDWTIRLSDKASNSDFSKIYYGFNEMVNEIDRLTKKNMQEQIMFKDAQMEALRYQINPHFLFNTLQTIEAIAEVYEVAEIQAISKSMGNMFRYNIRGFEIITLNEELTMIDSYMQIEKIRFGEEFEYEIDVAKTDREKKILKFILQPIVENCIQHGLKGSKKKWIKISSFSVDSVLTIQILNTGKQMEKEKMEQINALLDEARSSEDISWISSGIGMLNVHRRLITRFGPQYGVSILYSDERGTCVQLTMPKEYRKVGI